MAKKTAVATLKQFTVGGNLDVSDILSIVTAKAEDRYSAEIARCRKAVEDGKKQVIDLGKWIKNRIKEEVEAKYEADRKEIEKTLRRLFDKDIDVVLRSQDDIASDDQIHLTIIIKGSHTAYATKTLKPSRTLVKKIENREAAKVKITELMDEAVAWRRKLNNVPMLERKYKAKIARAKLNESVNGRKVLKTLEDDLEKTILALPEC